MHLGPMVQGTCTMGDLICEKRPVLRSKNLAGLPGPLLQWTRRQVVLMGSITPAANRLVARKGSLLVSCHPHVCGRSPLCSVVGPASPSPGFYTEWLDQVM